MTFEAWLIKQKKRQDPVGDLSRDFIGGKKLYGDKKCTHEMLSKRHACPEAHDSLDAALEEYHGECVGL